MRFGKGRRGTAEVIGTMFFLVIIFVVLANILWYNQATLEMNKHLSQKAASQIGLETTDGLTLRVNSLGSHDVELMGLWIIETDQNIHNYINGSVLVIDSLYVTAGSYVDIDVSGHVNGFLGEVTYRVLTDLGNIAITSYEYIP